MENRPVSINKLPKVLINFQKELKNMFSLQNERNKEPIRFNIILIIKEIIMRP